MAGGLAAFAAVIWHVAKLPIQPAHPAIARVVAIRPWEAGRFYYDRDEIVLRNAHGVGQFSMRDNQVSCKVGDEVSVEQRGVTLVPVASTCK